MNRLSNKTFLYIGIGISVFLASFVSFYASSSPDGLERVGTDHGFIVHAKDSFTSGSWLAGYGFEGVTSQRIAGGIAGAIGVLVTGIVAFFLFKRLGSGNKN